MAEWGKKGKGVTSIHTQGKDEVDEDVPSWYGERALGEKEKDGSAESQILRPARPAGRPAGWPSTHQR